jgi:hypothetical protein
MKSAGCLIPTLSPTAEATMLAKLKHPHVLALHGVCVAPCNTVYLVTELCPATLEQAVLEVREAAAVALVSSRSLHES